MTLGAFRFVTFFAFATFIPLGCFVYLKNRRSNLNQTFFLFMLGVSLWSFGFFLTMFPEMPYVVALWSSRMSHFFGTACPALMYLKFVVLFINQSRKEPLRIHWLHYFVAIGGAFTALTPWFIPELVPKRCFPYYPQPGPLYPFLLATYFGTFSYAFWLLGGEYIRLKNDRVRRQQILLTFLGVFLPWLNVATLFLLIYNVQITPVMVFFPAMLPVFAFSIIRYHFLNIRVVITRAGLLFATYLVVLGLPFAVGWRGRGPLEQRFGESWWLVPLGLCTVLATVGPFAYAYLRRQAEERLLRDQRRYQRILQRAAKGMTRVRNVGMLSQLIVRVLSRTIGLSHASLFLWDKERLTFHLKASHGPKRLSAASSYALDDAHPLCRQLADTRDIISRQMDEPSPASAVQQELARLDAWLIIPGFIEDEPVGFVALGEKLSGQPYSLDDLHAFSTLAHEAAIAIDNAKSYDELLKANEQLRAAYARLVAQERLAAAGQFATGMAHEIKNPLTAIKTFAEYLPEKYQDPAFREKFFRIVQSEIDRINTLVKELSDFAKPAPLQLQPVRLAAIAEDTLSLLSSQCLKHNVEIGHSFTENGLTIQADPQQLKQVLLNLCLNALEAMPNGGRLEVGTAVRGKQLILRVTDTGCGIDPEHQDKLWDPFFTTKERGMGLGLAIVKGIVERHGGTLMLRSRLGHGTTIELALPIDEQGR